MVLFHFKNHQFKPFKLTKLTLSEISPDIIVYGTSSSSLYITRMVLDEMYDSNSKQSSNNVLGVHLDMVPFCPTSSPIQSIQSHKNDLRWMSLVTLTSQKLLYQIYVYHEQYLTRCMTQVQGNKSNVLGAFDLIIFLPEPFFGSLICLIQPWGLKWHEVTLCFQLN